MGHTASTRRVTLPHLHRDRHGTFYFRVTRGGKTIRKSLRTKDPALASILAAKINWEWSMNWEWWTKKWFDKSSAEQKLAAIEADIEKLNMTVDRDGSVSFTDIQSDEDVRRARELFSAIAQIGTGPDDDQSFFRPLARPTASPPAPTLPPKEAMPFSKGVEKYFKQQVKLNETKTIEDKQATFKAFATLFPNADVGLIDKAQASDFKDLLLQGQANIARINKKLGHMSHFMGWAMIHGHAESNPFKGLEVGTRSQAAKLVDSYEQFTSEHLRRIFDPESYAEYADGKPHFYWLPFLLLHTGARPEELAGINLRNVCYEEEIHFFRVRSGKTTNSQRRIPFHKAVRESAFMDYLKKRKEEDPAGQLFPLLKDGKNGYLKNVSRRFNEIYLVKNLKIDEKTRKLYSFRTTFINGLTQSTGENAAKVMAIVGHYNQAGLDLSGVHFSTYQQDKPLKFLQQVMDSYQTIELPMKF